MKLGYKLLTQLELIDMEKQAGRRVAERPPKQKRSGKKLALIVLLVVVLALGAGYTGLCAAAGGGTLLPNTSIAGVDVGGLGPGAASPPVSPLMQGMLFVTTLTMVVSIVVSDIVCILIDPRVRWGETA